MNENIGKIIRLSDFIDSKSKRTLLLDTTIASCLGATTGLEDLSKTIKDLNYILNGIIVNPGQVEHLAELLGGKERAAPLIRVDWTNAYRNKDFCLPVSNAKWLMISNGEDAFQLGASAVIASFLMGFDEDIESDNIESLSLLARECYPLSLPLVIDVRPIGDKISDENFQGSIKLGISFMQELGADVLIIPDCNQETLEMIGDWLSIPVIIRLDEFPSEKKINTIFNAKLHGVLLSEKILSLPDFITKIKDLRSIIFD